MSGQFKELKRNPTRNTIVPIEIKISGSRLFIFCRLFVFSRSSNYSRLRFADLRWAGFLPQMFMRRTELSATTKLSAENKTPPIVNVLL